MGIGMGMGMGMGMGIGIGIGINGQSARRVHSAPHGVRYSGCCSRQMCDFIDFIVEGKQLDDSPLTLASFLQALPGTSHISHPRDSISLSPAHCTHLTGLAGALLRGCHVLYAVLVGGGIVRGGLVPHARAHGGDSQPTAT